MKSDLLSRIETSTGTGQGAGQLELLLFRLDDKTLYGINVFKIKEILPCPPINEVPMSDPRIIGLIDLRGHILSLVDLALALDLPPVERSGENICLYTEFSRQQLGFLVRNVERIIYVNWHAVRLPPETLSHNPYHRHWPRGRPTGVAPVPSGRQNALRHQRLQNQGNPAVPTDQ